MESVLSRLILIALNVKLWSGRRKLSTDDLGLAGTALPPDVVASLGSKRVCDPASIRVFANVKSAAERLLDQYGLRFLGGYLVPEQAAPQLMQHLKEYQQRFAHERQTFMGRYDGMVADWVAAHPTWAEVIRRGVVPAERVERQLQFSVEAYRVAAVDGVSTDLLQDIGQLEQTLRLELAAVCRQVLHESVAGRDRITRRAIRPLQMMTAKMEGLLFLSDEIQQLHGRVSSFLVSLPRRGHLSGYRLEALAALLQELSHGDQPCVSSDTGGESVMVPHSLPLVATPDGDLQQSWFF